MAIARSLLAALIAVLVASGTASAQEKLRVGKAVTNAFTFVPLDVGVAAGLFKAHGLDIDEYNFGGSAKLQQGLAAYDGTDDRLRAKSLLAAALAAFNSADIEEAQSLTEQSLEISRSAGLASGKRPR